MGYDGENADGNFNTLLDYKKEVLPALEELKYTLSEMPEKMSMDNGSNESDGGGCKNITIAWSHVNTFYP